MVESTSNFVKLITLYNEFKVYVSSLAVSNDVTEWNVKLIKDYIDGSQVEDSR